MACYPAVSAARLFPEPIFKLTKLSDDFFYPVIYSLFTANQEAGAKEFPKVSTINIPRTIIKEEAGR